jgi:hypothetical protein
MRCVRTARGTKQRVFVEAKCVAVRAHRRHAIDCNRAENNLPRRNPSRLNGLQTHHRPPVERGRAAVYPM